MSWRVLVVSPAQQQGWLQVVESSVSIAFSLPLSLSFSRRFSLLFSAGKAGVHSVNVVSHLLQLLPNQFCLVIVDLADAHYHSPFTDHHLPLLIITHR